MRVIRIKTKTIILFFMLMTINGLTYAQWSQDTEPSLWEDKDFLFAWNLQELYITAALRRYQQQVPGFMTWEEARKAIWIEKYGVSSIAHHFSRRMRLCTQGQLAKGQCLDNTANTLLLKAYYREETDESRTAFWAEKTLDDFIKDVITHRRNLIKTFSGSSYHELFNIPDQDKSDMRTHGFIRHPDPETQYSAIYLWEYIQWVETFRDEIISPLTNTCNHQQSVLLPSYKCARLTLLEKQDLMYSSEFQNEFPEFVQLARKILTTAEQISCSMIAKAQEEYILISRKYCLINAYNRSEFIRYIVIHADEYYLTGTLPYHSADLLQSLSHQQMKEFVASPE